MNNRPERRAWLRGREEFLVVVIDRSGTRTVCLTWPDVKGQYASNNHGGILELRGTDLKVSAPRWSPAYMTAAALLVVVVTLVVCVWSTIWRAVLAGVVAVLLATVGAMILSGVARLRSRWNEEAITLDEPAEIRSFDRAYEAGKDLVDSWDRVRTFLPADEFPTRVGPDVRDSLWSLAGLFVRCSELSRQLGTINEALSDVSSQTEVFSTLQRRRERVEGQVELIEATLRERVAALEGLAAESASFAHYIEAVERALHVIEDIDRTTETSGYHDDLATGMADRTRGLVLAYREVTSRK
jgi:hypothetical protein